MNITPQGAARVEQAVIRARYEVSEDAGHEAASVAAEAFLSALSDAVTRAEEAGITGEEALSACLRVARRAAELLERGIGRVNLD